MGSMLSWFRKGRKAQAEAATPFSPEEGALPSTQLETGERPGAEAFMGAWGLLEAAEEGAEVMDPCPISESVQTLIDLMQPLMWEHFEHHPPTPAAFPAVAIQVLSLLEKQDPELPALLGLISQDPALTMHVLQVANSAYYHRGHEVQDLQTAVMKMGVVATGEAVTAIAGRTLFDPSLRAEMELFNTRMRDLYQSSLSTAFAAREFSEQSRLGKPHLLFLAGMFHDIGHTISLRVLASLMVAGKVPKNLPFLALNALCERTHVQMGTTALAIWGLPPYLIELCSGHHQATVPHGGDHQNLHILRVVSGLNRLLLDASDPSHASETRQSLRALGHDRTRAWALFQRIMVHRERVKEMFPI
jgi:HD-like signal output (HDOD) protein